MGGPTECPQICFGRGWCTARSLASDRYQSPGESFWLVTGHPFLQHRNFEVAGIKLTVKRQMCWMWPQQGKEGTSEQQAYADVNLESIKAT